MLSPETLKKFRAAFAQGGELDASQFKFLNLADLAERYGPRWPKVRARIFETCESFLSKRIGEHDVLLRASNGFLVLPAPSRAESAADFAKRLEIELKEFFLGTDYLKELDLYASTIPLTLETLMEAAAGPQGKAAKAEDEVAKPLSSAPAPLRQQPKFDVRYAPVWSPVSGYIALYDTVPIRRAAKGPVLTHHQILSGDRTYQELLEFDLDVLGRAVAEISFPLPCGGRHGLVSVPVHFLTLTTPRLRIVYVRALSELPDHVRAALAIRILAAPSDAPSGRYDEAVCPIRSRCRRIFLDIDHRSADLRRFDARKLDGFVLRAPDGLNAYYREMDGLVRFVRAADRLGIGVGMLECTSRDVVREATAIGVKLFGGRIFPAAQDRPGLPQRFDPFTARFLRSA